MRVSGLSADFLRPVKSRKSRGADVRTQQEILRRIHSERVRVLMTFLTCDRRKNYVEDTDEDVKRVFVIRASADVLYTKKCDLCSGINTLHPSSACCSTPHLVAPEIALFTCENSGESLHPILWTSSGVHIWQQLYCIQQYSVKRGLQLWLCAHVRWKMSVSTDVLVHL